MTDDIKLPYVVQPTKIREWFNKISVETPSKFTMKFLEEVMLFKNRNDRNLISLLKNLDFLDANGTPTQNYDDYKIEDLAKTTLGKGVKIAFNEIYRRKKYFAN